jgi:epoxyqueuosine reductase QueG
MNVLTSAKIKAFALAQGLDLIGVASIARFAGAPGRMHPSAIMPEAKSVVVVARRILRGNWRDASGARRRGRHSWRC